MKQISSLLIILLVFALVNVNGQSDSFKSARDPQQIKFMIKDQANKTNSISCDFTQEKHLIMMLEVLVSIGCFLFKKENKV